MTIGERIKTLRKAIDPKMSQTRFAESIGKTRSAVAAYELNAVVPDEAIIKLICQTYKVSYAWLKFGADVEMFNKPETRREKVNALLDGENEFAKEVMDFFLDLGDDEWVLLKKLVDRVKEKNKKAGQ